ncbi:hypothetical protein RRG08_008143 [Elysia crispata]|uniref:Uncharacterized protein n=1 Tax=Elysia crispata TaxID=231223 RepID=A0AAE0Z6F3_9GAST|nr:hypothetical protein RRG08_008143 [Elysia crispata]
MRVLQVQVYRGDTGRSTRSEVAYYPDQWLNYMKSKERAGHRHKPEQKLRVREDYRAGLRSGYTWPSLKFLAREGLVNQPAAPDNKAVLSGPRAPSAPRVVDREDGNNSIYSLVHALLTMSHYRSTSDVDLANTLETEIRENREVQPVQSAPGGSRPGHYGADTGPRIRGSQLDQTKASLSQRSDRDKSRLVQFSPLRITKTSQDLY